MTDLNPDTITRGATVVLAMFALIMLAIRFPRWARLPRRQFLTTVGLVVLLAAVAYGIVEGLVLGVAGAPRFVGVAVGVGLLALAQGVPAEDRPKDPGQDDTRRNR